MMVGVGQISSWLIGGYVACYLAALATLVVATSGLVRLPRHPSSALLLLPLVLPCTLLLEPVPELLGPWLVVLAPTLGIVLLAAFCWWRARADDRRAPAVGLMRPRPAESHSTSPMRQGDVRCV